MSNSELPPLGPPGTFGEESGTRQRIILAASQVFCQNGFSRSTTRGIAKAAGVSEVTVFRYFDSKANLFKAAMEAYGAPHVIRQIESRLTGDYREDLLLIGTIFTHIMLERAETVVLVMSEVRHFPEMQPMFAQQPGSLWQMLARYLQKKMEEGTVRAVQPEIVAQAFFGACFAYAMQRKMFALVPKPGLDVREFAEQVVDVFYHGTVAQQNGKVGEP